MGTCSSALLGAQHYITPDFSTFPQVQLAAMALDAKDKIGEKNSLSTILSVYIQQAVNCVNVVCFLFNSLLNEILLKVKPKVLFTSCKPY